ncbi:type I glyceraldehyde-3-phosphate dehydrogenase, partial [Candidatus Woesearchaeota archaeon]|nr:type I glyceraldehyde-3-phosphate dehydrogenase [Candidatus Woesearchaeota archaeon]
KDLRRARAAAVNIIPTTTGAAKLVGKLIKGLDGKIDGRAWRVQIPCGSIVQFAAEVSRKVTVEQVNQAYKKAVANMKGILKYETEPIVSHDIVRNPHSCIFDSLCTDVIDGTFVTVSAWYDNEWGYSCRMVDMLKKL